ncbi:hypothetical protein K8I28_00095 [bacterium]|nr:hypothetical protein [bacterium]
MPALQSLEEIASQVNEANQDMLELLSEMLSPDERMVFFYKVAPDPSVKEDEFYVVTNRRLIQILINTSLNSRSRLTTLYLNGFTALVYRKGNKGDTKIRLRCATGTIGFEISSNDNMRDFYKVLNNIVDYHQVEAAVE